MKKSTLLPALAIAFAFASPAFANKEVGNGGDLCEDRIKIVRDDLSTWILNDGAATMIYPAGVTPEIYKSRMLTQMSEALISCTNEVLKVGEAEKTCLNFQVDGSPARMVCNTQLLNAISETDQYVLVHHEFAGLAGFEMNHGETSDYSLSDQVSGYLTDQIVKKLAVKPKFPPGSNTCTLIPPGRTDRNNTSCSTWGVALDGFYFSTHPCFNEASQAQEAIDRSPVCHAPALTKGDCALLPPNHSDNSNRTCSTWSVTYKGFFISDRPCADTADLAYAKMVASPLCHAN